MILAIGTGTCRGIRVSCNWSRLATVRIRSAIQRLPDCQKVAPGETLLQRAAQQERWVKRRHGADVTLAGVEREPAPAGLGDAVARAEQRLRRRVAHADQNVGIDELDLAQDERQADLRFLRR